MRKLKNYKPTKFKAKDSYYDTEVKSTTISNWYKQVYEPVYSAG